MKLKRLTPPVNIEIRITKLIFALAEFTLYYRSLTKQITIFLLWKRPPRGVLRKRSSENLQQIYRGTPKLKCNFNKVVSQLYWNYTSIWVFSCKLVAYFQNSFLKEHFRWVAFVTFTLHSSLPWHADFASHLGLIDISVRGYANMIAVT